MKEKVNISGFVNVVHRKFVPDINGNELSLDGNLGFFAENNLGNSNLITSVGRDFLHLNGYETTGLGTNGANYMALSSNTDAPTTADTTLTGEITNGGLIRIQGTVTHVAGSTTSTVNKTFTSSATHTSVQKCGLFTAVSAGTMVHEATFSSVNLESSDQLAVTWTITLS